MLIWSHLSRRHLHCNLNSNFYLNRSDAGYLPSCQNHIGLHWGNVFSESVFAMATSRFCITWPSLSGLSFKDPSSNTESHDWLRCFAIRFSYCHRMETPLLWSATANSTIFQQRITYPITPVAEHSILLGSCLPGHYCNKVGVVYLADSPTFFRAKLAFPVRKFGLSRPWNGVTDLEIQASDSARTLSWCGLSCGFRDEKTQRGPEGLLWFHVGRLFARSGHAPLCHTERFEAPFSTGSQTCTEAILTAQAADW